MIANIFEKGKRINRIVADEAFAAEYCAQNGYTYEMEPEPEPTPPEKTYTADDLLAALLSG